jgi:hypothetical protein
MLLHNITWLTFDALMEQGAGAHLRARRGSPNSFLTEIFRGSSFPSVGKRQGACAGGRIQGDPCARKSESALCAHAAGLAQSKLGGLTAREAIAVRSKRSTTLRQIPERLRENSSANGTEPSVHQFSLEKISFPGSALVASLTTPKEKGGGGGSGRGVRRLPGS